MRIYTKKGDGGETGLLGGSRTSKSDPRIHALGSLDELNASLGFILASAQVPLELREVLGRIQNVLFDTGAALASTDPSAKAEIFPPETAWLESVIDGVEAKLPPLDRFILPGGSPSGAALHWARTVCRRAEREVVATAQAQEERAPLLAYINRLSDALFVLARRANQIDGVAEIAWEARS